MFNFSKDDNSQTRFPSYRLSTYKHNPYIGSFHSVKRVSSKFSNCNNVILSNHQIVDSKSPFIPMFRHAPPSSLGSSIGLKSLLINGEFIHKPVLTQVQVQREKNNISRQIFPDLLKNLPLSRFDTASSICSSLKDEDWPLCSICLETFKDGDELRTLTCSHCYHRRCIDIWLLGCLSDSETDTYNCPQCRKCIDSTVIPTENKIPENVFLSIGQSLTKKDLEALSDISSDDDLPRDLSITPDTSDLPSISDSNRSITDLLLSEKLKETLGDILFDIDDSQIPIPGKKSPDQDDPICGSKYSDCGFPLI